MNEINQTMIRSSSDDETNLRELVRKVWADKWLVGGITFAATVIAVFYALMLPNIYRAEALLAPNDREGAGGLSALAAQYGGFASLAGINLDRGSADKAALGLKVLKSRKFISEYIKRHDILVPLMASTGWNATSGELMIDPDIFDTEAREWERDVRPPKTSTPSSQESYKAFSELLSVSQDQKTGFITVSIDHYSPNVAKRWVDWLVEDINRTIMQEDVVEAEQAIEYLNGQIAATSLADLQDVFFRLIEEQTKTMMLANVSPEYVYRTVDPALAPEIRAKPRRALIAVFGMLLGGVVSVVIVFVRNGIVVGRE